MGIVNASPDSFSDGGAARDARRPGRARASELLADGADILDIGGESASTGSPPVAAARGDRARRAADRARSPAGLGRSSRWTPTSRRSRAAAIAAGARIVNDVSGLRDPELADVCARDGRGARPDAHGRARRASACRTPTSTSDVDDEVLAFLRERIDVALAAGVEPRAADRRPRPGLRQDAGADDPPAVRAGAAARAGAPAADGDLAQGLHRRADRARARASGSPGTLAAARARRRRRARTSSACTTSPPPRTSSPCGPRSAGRGGRPTRRAAR